MGAAKQQRRKQQRLIKAKKAKKELANATPLPASESAYKIVGSIAPEVFDTPEIPQCTSSPYKIVDGIASETIAFLDSNQETVSNQASDRCEDVVMEDASAKSSTSESSENGIDGVQEVDEAKDAACFQFMESFSSAFTFGVTLTKKEKMEAFHHPHAPTPTSTRRIEAIFPDDRLFDATTISTNTTTTKKDATNTPSIFERLQTSKAPTTIHLLKETPETEKGEDQQQPVLFCQSPNILSFVSTLTLETATRDTDSDMMRLFALGKPSITIPAAVTAWVHDQSLQIFNLEDQKASSIALADKVSTASSSDANLQQDNSTQQSKNLTKPTVASAEHTSANQNDQNWALVLYHIPFSQSSEDSTSDPFEDDDDVNTESSSSSWNVSRVFMVTMDGSTHLVDHRQMLYNNVRVIDEDASDFDSIASPWKDLPVVDFEANSPCVFDLDNDDDTTSEEREDSILQLHLDKRTEERREIHTDDENSSPGQEGSQETTEEVREAELEMSPDGSRPDKLIHVNVDDALDISQDSTAIKDDKKSNKESTAVTDWARALTHTMLGTESLFTYFTILEVKTNGNATKIALATAFLQLVDFERQKLEETLLPHSCSASSILGSKVLPHTIMLGTTSLAAFLSELEFDANDKATLVSVFEAFKKLSEREVQVRNMAAQGIMGDLLRALGRSA